MAPAIMTLKAVPAYASNGSDWMTKEDKAAAKESEKAAKQEAKEAAQDAKRRDK